MERPKGISGAVPATRFRSSADQYRHITQDRVTPERLGPERVSRIRERQESIDDDDQTVVGADDANYSSKNTKGSKNDTNTKGGKNYDDQSRSRSRSRSRERRRRDRSRDRSRERDRSRSRSRSRSRERERERKRDRGRRDRDKDRDRDRDRDRRRQRRRSSSYDSYDSSSDSSDYDEKRPLKSSGQRKHRDSRDDKRSRQRDRSRSRSHSRERKTRPRRSSDLGDEEKNVGTHQYPKEEPVSEEEDVKPLLTTSGAPAPPEVDPFLVIIGPDDKNHPYNYSLARKWFILSVVCSAALAVTATSSIGGSANAQLQRQFKVGNLTTVAGTSLFALGLATGGLIFAPLSEFLGRRYIFLIAFTLFTIFNLPVAFAQNIAPYLAFRFLTGFVGTAFLSVAGGVVSDMWRPGTTDWPVAVYTLSPLLGPALGPIVGGFIGQNASWRIIFYTVIAWSAVELVAIFFFVPETQLSILQKRKAQALRSKDQRYQSPLEKLGRSFPVALRQSFTTFVQILLFEKMAFLLNIWASLILGIIYLFFGGIPFTFRTRYGFNLQSTGLAFIPLGAGQLAALFTTGFFARKIRESAARNNGSPQPESRLLVGIAGAVVTPLGLFWLAFTSYPRVRFIVPFFGLFLFGAGSSFVFFCIFGFLIAVYRQNAAAALAGNTFARCLLAGGFPLIGPTFYGRLGAVRATATLAGITSAFVPIPFVLYKYGPKLRSTSKFVT